VPEEQAGAQEQLTTTSAPASSGSHQAALNQSVAGAQSGNGTTSSKGEHLGDSEDVQGHYAGDQEEEEGDAGSSDDDGDEDGNAKDTEAGDEDSLQGYGEEVEQAMAHLSAEEKKITRKNVSRALKLMAQVGRQESAASSRGLLVCVQGSPQTEMSTGSGVRPEQHTVGATPAGNGVAMCIVHAARHFPLADLSVDYCWYYAVVVGPQPQLQPNFA
jgi:hypothetical protein